jgi:DNA replication and repair protein RecF
MRLETLRLVGFRNYDAAELTLDPGVNLILGENAQGKTNLLEAVTYLSTGRSFRTRREQELIGFGREFADLSATLDSGGRAQSLRAVLFTGRRRRQLFVGGVKQKTAAALPGVLTTVLFCPEDLLILKSGASARRRLIDNALCQLRPNYDRALREYGRLIDHKSQILKNQFDRPDLLQTLPEFNERIATVGAIVIHYRAKYLRTLAERAAVFHRDCSGGRETLTLTYQTVSTVDDPFAPTQEIAAQLRAHLASHAAAEQASAQCLSGPHRDDFDASLDGVSIRSYGSQGQTRTAAIALKLAERAIFFEDTGEEPVLLLDDVLSELDATRRDFVLNQIRSGQVLITSCEEHSLPKSGKIIQIQAGNVVI